MHAEEAGKEKRAADGGTSGETSTSLVPVLQEMIRSEGFEPFSVALSSSWDRGRWVALRAVGAGMLSILMASLLIDGGRAAFADWFLPFHAGIVLPLLGVVALGSTLDHLTRSSPDSLRTSLQRRLVELLAIAPSYLFHALTLVLVTDLLFPNALSSMVQVFLLCGLFWFGSLSFGHSVAQRRLAGRSPLAATLRGPWLALRSLVALPPRVLGALGGRPVADGGAGLLAQYHLLTWGLGAAGAALAGLLLNWGLRGLIGWLPWAYRLPAELFLLGVVTALALELGASTCATAYLPFLVEDEPHRLPEDSGSAAHEGSLPEASRRTLPAS